MAELAPSLDAQICEVDRELRLRRHLYPIWIARGQLKQATADHQLAVMEEVQNTLLSLQRSRSA